MFAAVHPRVAIFAVGYHKLRHPKQEVVRRYTQAGSRICRSDHDGAEIVDIAAGGPAVQSWRDSYQRYWLAAPDMTSLTAETE